MGRLAGTLQRPTVTDTQLIERVRQVAIPLGADSPNSYDPLLEAVGDARIVLIGEASHGTHEFYRERALITTRLIREKGFDFVAIEGDWPEAQRVNAYVRGGEGTARDVMDAFTVFPTWMWGNVDALHFIEWLRRYNDALPAGAQKVGFYGLDLYSLFASIQAVIDYLDRVDPQAGEAARQRYACFEPYERNRDLYAYNAGLGIAKSCEEEAIAMLRELQQRGAELADASPDDAHFCAEMSARAARDGERYYRSMYNSDELSWNLRDIHMMDTLDALLEHFDGAKAVVWEHNTHIGDFRATADADGMVNVGQLVRERHPGESTAIGFGTYAGSVTAATAWGRPPEHMRVPEAQRGSFDQVFHEAVHQGAPDRFLLLLRELRERGEAAGLEEWRGQRAIGVVYHPEREYGNYVPTRLAERYDAYIHIDRTHAVKPLRIEPSWTAPLPQTYPSGY